MLASLEKESRAFVVGALADLEDGDDEAIAGLVEATRMTLGIDDESSDDIIKAELLEERRQLLATSSSSQAAAAGQSSDAAAAAAADAKSQTAARIDDSDFETTARKADILNLTEVVPQASRLLIARLLEKHIHDVNAALEALLAAASDGSLDKLEDDCHSREIEARKLASKEEKRRAKEEKRRRADVVARNEEVAVGNLAPPRIPYASSSKKDANKLTQTFYRDGQAMLLKGSELKNQSKFEKKEEWDGGSTGRVKTKGKRGPGWA